MDQVTPVAVGTSASLPPQGEGNVSPFTAMSDLGLVEETMTKVRRNWNVMLQDQFNPIMVALEMLQNSNPAHDYDSFLQLHGKLEEAMTVIVEKYYTGFNNAVSIFGGIVDNTKGSFYISRSFVAHPLSVVAKDIATQVCTDVAEFHDQIQFKRTELPEIWSKVRQFKDTTVISSKLQGIQKQQSHALDLARKKFFIPAARMIMGAIYDSRYLRDAQLAASSELAKLLEANRDSLFDMIIDEVHALLYLKNLKASQQLFNSLANVVPEARSLSIGQLKRSTEVAVPDLDADLTLAPAEFNFDPTSNALAYLNSLVRAAAIMELLPQLLTIITQRIVAELYQITSKLLQECNREFRKGAGFGDNPLFVPVLRGSMSKSEANEFDAFVPHLQRLCDKAFGHFLVIAHAVSLIGQEVSRIVQEAGSAIDITSFYKNCLSALHGEVKSLLTAFLHSSKSAARPFASTTVAITDALKGRREQKGSSQAPLYQFINVCEAEELAGLSGVGKVLGKDEEIAAHRIATMLAVDPFSPSRKDVGHQAIVKPNLQYLAILYQPFAQFDDWLSVIYGTVQSDGQYVDAVYVETVLSQEYLPSIENYMTQELTKAFNGADSLLWHSLIEPDQTMAIGRGSHSLLMCASAFVGLVSQVASVAHQIPGSQAECEKLILNLMAQFLERCDTKFRELVTSKTSSDDATAPTFVAISSAFVAHAPLRELLMQHTMLTGAEDADLDLLIAQRESVILEKLKSDRSLHRNEIIFDYRIIRSLALLQRSLELIPQILADSKFGVVPSFPLHRPEMRNGEGGKLMCNFFDRVHQSLLVFTPNFESQYGNFISALKRLATNCLFILRIELRVHGFYFLDLAYREGSYDLEELVNEPDPYVSSLASDLTRFESLMAEWLPYSRYHVVMDELDQSLTSMLLSDFRYIRSLNAAGCHKLEMNVATLEQILALLNSGSSSSLELARQFYRLARAGPERFIEMVPDCPYKYTMQQYQAIFDVYYRDSSGDADVRKMYHNQLVRLKYLLDDQAPEESVMMASKSSIPSSPRKK